jgi:hypothetical protein
VQGRLRGVASALQRRGSAAAPQRTQHSSESPQLWPIGAHLGIPSCYGTAMGVHGPGWVCGLKVMVMSYSPPGCSCPAQHRVALRLGLGLGGCEMRPVACAMEGWGMLVLVLTLAVVSWGETEQQRAGKLVTPRSWGGVTGENLP